MKRYFWIETLNMSKVVCSGNRCGWIEIPDQVFKGDIQRSAEEYVYSAVGNSGSKCYIIMEESDIDTYLDMMGYINKKKKEEECRALVVTPPPPKPASTTNFKCCECHTVVGKNILKQEVWLFCRVCRCNTKWDKTEDPVKTVLPKSSYKKPETYSPRHLQTWGEMKLNYHHKCVTCLKPILISGQFMQTTDGPKHVVCVMGYTK